MPLTLPLQIVCAGVFTRKANLSNFVVADADDVDRRHYVLAAAPDFTSPGTVFLLFFIILFHSSLPFLSVTFLPSLPTVFCPPL